MSKLPVEVVNHTDHNLAVEWEWEGMAGAVLVGPESGRLVVTVTQLDKCGGDDD